VAIGHLIPAGTGLPEYRKIRTYPLDAEEEDEGLLGEESVRSA
jgi:hypothetical protein